jgi:OOP family OmpA-OmpF porin
MTGTAKFLIGAAVTSLLAWGAHTMYGDGYVDGIEEKARDALTIGEYDGIELNMQRDALSRVAVLSGTSDPEKRAAIEETVLASANVSSVVWQGDADEAPAAAAVSDEAVASCQSEVEALMEGKTINFATGSAAISADSGELLDSLGAAIAGCEGMSVAISGHTDSTGNADANQILSQARADAVAASLGERGLGADRMSTQGFGSTKPLVADDGANAANRRIEFTLSAADAAPEAAPTEGGE